MTPEEYAAVDVILDRLNERQRHALYNRLRADFENYATVVFDGAGNIVSGEENLPCCGSCGGRIRGEMLITNAGMFHMDTCRSL